jgi:hypothetical protein
VEDYVKLSRWSDISKKYSRRQTCCDVQLKFETYVPGVAFGQVEKDFGITVILQEKNWNTENIINLIVF